MRTSAQTVATQFHIMESAAPDMFAITRADAGSHMSGGISAPPTSASSHVDEPRGSMSAPTTSASDHATANKHMPCKTAGMSTGGGVSAPSGGTVHTAGKIVQTHASEPPPRRSSSLARSPSLEVLSPSSPRCACTGNCGVRSCKHFRQIRQRAQRKKQDCDLATPICRNLPLEGHKYCQECKCAVARCVTSRIGGQRQLCGFFCRKHDSAAQADKTYANTAGSFDYGENWDAQLKAVARHSVWIGVPSRTLVMRMRGIPF